MNRRHDAPDTETEEDLDRLIAEQMLDLPRWWHIAEKRQRERDMRPIRTNTGEHDASANG